MVKDEDKAWHAGVSELWDKPACNGYSLGVSLVGDGRVPFTPQQYEMLAMWCTEKMEQWDILLSWIAPHSMVALPKGRKDDPKPFDWKKFNKLLGV